MKQANQRVPYPNGINDVFPSADLTAEGEKPFDYLRIDGSVRTYLPARVESPVAFHALAANVIKCIVQAKKDAEVGSYAPLLIVLTQNGDDNYWGISGALLRDIAMVSGSEVMRFELDLSLSLLRLQHGNCRQTLKLKPMIPNADVPVILDFHSRPAEKQLDKWVGKAVSKEAHRPNLQKNWGWFATDAYRIHMDSRIPLAQHDDASLPEHDLSQVKKQIKMGESLPCVAVVPVKPFVQSVRGAKAGNKDKIVLKFSRTLFVGGEGNDGVSTGRVIDDGYQFKGRKVQKILVNPKYVIDALSGMNTDKITEGE